MDANWNFWQEVGSIVLSYVREGNWNSWWTRKKKRYVNARPRQPHGAVTTTKDLLVLSFNHEEHRHTSEAVYCGGRLTFSLKKQRLIFRMTCWNAVPQGCESEVMDGLCSWWGEHACTVHESEGGSTYPGGNHTSSHVPSTATHCHLQRHTAIYSDTLPSTAAFLITTSLSTVAVKAPKPDKHQQTTDSVRFPLIRPIVNTVKCLCIACWTARLRLFLLLLQPAKSVFPVKILESVQQGGSDTHTHTHTHTQGSLHEPALPSSESIV